MWTEEKILNTLRDAETDILRQWAAETGTSLWHLNRDLFGRNGAARLEAVRILEALRVYCQRRNSGAPISEEAGSECARSLAALPLAWADVRTLLAILNAQIRLVLAERGADPDTLDIYSGFLAAVGGEAADLRVQTLEAELSARREEEVVTQHLAGRFLANASHELRTPLTAVLGFSELLQEGSYGAL